MKNKYRGRMFHNMVGDGSTTDIKAVQNIEDEFSGTGGWKPPPGYGGGVLNTFSPDVDAMPGTNYLPEEYPINNGLPQTYSEPTGGVQYASDPLPFNPGVTNASSCKELAGQIAQLEQQKLTSKMTQEGLYLLDNQINALKKQYSDAGCSIVSNDPTTGTGGIKTMQSGTPVVDFHETTNEGGAPTASGSSSNGGGAGAGSGIMDKVKKHKGIIIILVVAAGTVVAYKMLK